DKAASDDRKDDEAGNRGLPEAGHVTPADVRLSTENTQRLRVAQRNVPQARRQMHEFRVRLTATPQSAVLSGSLWAQGIYDEPGLPFLFEPSAAKQPGGDQHLVRGLENPLEVRGISLDQGKVLGEAL